MNRDRWVCAGTVMAIWLGPASLQGQAVLGLADRPVAEICEIGSLGERLRSAHPLGAARAANHRCLDGPWTWVPTAPMAPDQLERWARALESLETSGRPRCRAAAAVLDRLERQGRVSVWAEVDTVGGMLYLGAAYLDREAAPLAVQFWAPAFDRALDWFAGAAAHEAFHVLRPGEAEAEAIAFGAECAAAVALRQVGRPAGEWR